MVKLKDLLNEVSPGYKDRQFGDPLPTLKDVMKEKMMKDLELGKVYTDKDMPPFQVKEETINEAPEHQLAAELNKVSDNIIKIANKYKKKADVDGMVRSWMLGLKSRMKKSGIKAESNFTTNDLQRAIGIYNDFEDIISKFGKDVVRITKDVEKLKGEKTDSKIIIKQYVKGMNPFLALIRSWFKGEQRRRGGND
tara:strand:- start:172 stop:756 length:585 start_codon:yes stop_codon:yes gene_type:complete